MWLLLGKIGYFCPKRSGLCCQLKEAVRRKSNWSFIANISWSEHLMSSKCNLNSMLFCLLWTWMWTWTWKWTWTSKKCTVLCTKIYRKISKISSLENKHHSKTSSTLNPTLLTFLDKKSTGKALMSSVNDFPFWFFKHFTQYQN